MNGMNLTQSLLFNPNLDIEKICYLYQDQQVSYGKMQHDVQQWSQYLLQRNVNKKNVLIMMDETPTQAALFFSIIAVGSVPIIANPRLKPHEIDHIIKDSNIELIFSDFGLSSPSININHVVLPEAENILFCPKQSYEVAVIQYTSGSTGTPKGVHHSTQAILSCCKSVSEHLGLKDSDIIYSVSKSFFGFGMGNSLFFPLYNQATAILDCQWPTIDLIKQNLSRFQPTVLFAVPTVFNHLLELEQLNLRLAQSSGSHLPIETALKWKEKFGIELLNAIGSTELLHIFAGTKAENHKLGSVGRVMNHNAINIVDETGHAVVQGEVGKLLIHSPVLALGYTENNRFHTLEPSWFATGDLCSQDDEGFLYFHGRADDRFKVNGRWVIPLEMENKIRQYYPAIHQCYVTCVEDQNAFEQVVLIVIGALDHDTILALNNINCSLPKYQNIDEILLLDQVPINSNGKVDRKQLKNIAYDFVKTKSFKNITISSYGIDQESYQQFIDDGYNLVPLWKEIDIQKKKISTPQLYEALVGTSGGFLFEQYDHQSDSCSVHYSIIGLDVNERIEIHDHTLKYVLNSQTHWEKIVEHPLLELQKLQKTYHVPKICELPPFFGGYFGYFGFETTRLIEPRLKLSDRKSGNLQIPDIVQILSKRVVVIDHQKSAVYCVVHANANNFDESKKACDDLSKKVIECLNLPQNTHHQKRQNGLSDITYSIDKHQFMQKVEAVQQYIQAGDVMQVVLSHQMTTSLECDALTYYKALKELSYTPYTYCIDLQDFQIIGASPEELVRYQDQHVSSRPMAGTRRRTGKKGHDSLLAAELIKDPKERAEHMMLVDLARNDLGKIALPGCVCVEELMQVELYSHVMHLVSTVTAPTSKEVTGLDALIATFPAGTLSGASKVRALEVISELETQSRGVYGGVIGYIDWQGNADLAIAIRTGVLKNKTLYVQAGAGIVSDSIAENEWQETMDKSRLLFAAAVQVKGESNAPHYR